MPSFFLFCEPLNLHNCLKYLGVANLDSGVGVYAPDAESYKKFAAIFDPIIDEYHGGFGPNVKHPPTDFGENKTTELKDLDPDGKYILSTRFLVYF